MYDLFFNNGAAWYTIPAIIGTAFFSLRIILLLAGAGDGGIDFHDGDVHFGAGGDADPHHSTHDFQILSVQSICAFAMGFGWVGLAGLKGGTDWGPFMVNVAAVGGGAGMVWLLAMLLRGIASLQSSGNVSIQSAAGREGDVYLTVPGAGGRGQVRVTVENRQRIYNAVTTGEDLPTGTRVRVVKVNEDNTLTVARA